MSDYDQIILHDALVKLGFDWIGHYDNQSESYCFENELGQPMIYVSVADLTVTFCTVTVSAKDAIKIYRAMRNVLKEIYPNHFSEV